MLDRSRPSPHASKPVQIPCHEPTYTRGVPRTPLRSLEGRQAGETRGFSGTELLSAFVNDDEGVYRTDVARIDQPFSLDVRGICLERADVLGVEFEDLRSNLHAVRGTDAEGAINADRQTADFSFDEISDDRPPLLPALITRGPVRASPLRTSWMDPRAAREQP